MSELTIASGDEMCIRKLLSKVEEMRISIGQGPALRPILIRPDHKRLRIVTVSIKEKSSNVRLKALQEPVKSVSGA